MAAPAALSTSLAAVPLLSFSVWAYPIWVGCAVLAGWSGYRALRDRPVILKQLIAAGVVEAMLLIQAILAIGDVAGGKDLVEPVVFWGYVIVGLLLLPAAGVVSIAERTRWSSVAYLVLVLAVAVVEVRMLSLWAMGSGA